MTSEWERLEQLAAAYRKPAAFDPDTLRSDSAVVQRYLAAAIAPGTPLATGARLKMRGRIKLGRWLPFRARQLLVPNLGTVWAARVAGVISGSDRYVNGVGGMDWKLLGLVHVMHAEGADVTRSAAERAAGESIWAPTALTSNSTFKELDSNRIAVTVDVDGHPVELEHHLDDKGHLTTSSFRRWGDPDNSGTWAEHPFGIEATRTQAYRGVSIPAEGRAGWHFGTDRWEDGVFFRYEITHYELFM